jgi:hypothetical protein
MPTTPGTVSKILWHFTGGPKWDEAAKCQESRPKPAEEAYAALLGILKSGHVCLGKYREVVRVTVQTRRSRTPTLIPDERPDWVDVEYKSSPVCCVADIPVAHLAYHAERYGKIAIGFYRESALRAGFNPVFYTLHKAGVLRAIHEAFNALGRIDRPDRLASDTLYDIEGTKCAEGTLLIWASVLRLRLRLRSKKSATY